jgi:hypothetical protein
MYPLAALSNAMVTAFDVLQKTWDAADNVTAQAQKQSQGVSGAQNGARTVFTVVSGAQMPFDAAHASSLSSAMGYGTGATATANATTAVNGILGGLLGGVDHSIPAIIGPSAVAGSATRAQVAYVGALDGMLHAFLVSGTVGTITTPGQELWAFIPPAQLSRIGQYAAGVDGSPQAGDAFILDPTTHQHRWATLLAVTQGDYGNPQGTFTSVGTVDVLDVTDPASPRWLWTASPTPVGAYKMGTAKGSAFATLSLPTGPTYSVVVATNNQGTGTCGTLGCNGVNVYALDASTGNKLWEWNHLSTQTTPPANTQQVPNDVPGPPSAVSSAGQSGPADQIFLGDIDGNVWKLSAASGTGTKIFTGGSGQPIESGIALFRDNNACTGSVCDLDVLWVTGGADWVPTSALSNVYVADTFTGQLKPPLTLQAGERVYAAPTFAGNDAYLITSFGQLSGNLGSTGTQPGYLRRINLAGAAGAGSTLSSQTVTSVNKGASEVAVASDGSLIGASAIGMTRLTNAGRDTRSTALNNQVAKPFTVKAWINFR